MKKYSLWIVMVAALTSAASAQNKGPQVATLDEIKEDLKAAPCKSADRFDGVKKLFQKMGASDADMTIGPDNDVRNIVLTKKGTGSGTVVIGAHYDKVGQGCGVIDNWSGVVILAHAYRTMKSMDTDKTYIFAAFDKKEIVLAGSAAMAKGIPKEARAGYCSMVNLDSFGLGFPYVLENVSTLKMVRAAKELGSELKVQVKGIMVPGTAEYDSSSFKDKDIPAITLSGLSEGWPSYVHTSNDKIENANAASVRVGYQFVLNLLVKIDTGACDMYKEK